MPWLVVLLGGKGGVSCFKRVAVAVNEEAVQRLSRWFCCEK